MGTWHGMAEAFISRVRQQVCEQICRRQVARFAFNA